MSPANKIKSNDEVHSVWLLRLLENSKVPSSSDSGLVPFFRFCPIGTKISLFTLKCIANKIKTEFHAQLYSYLLSS